MRPIFIVGYMGAGKSTLGRKLAECLGLQFIDTDIFIENRFRKRIADMFAEIGEEAFRKREMYVIQELSGMTDCIIATGGGLPCYYGNMELMNESGLTIYLKSHAENLAERLEQCKRTRPTIREKSGDELLNHIQHALSERSPIYEQAHIILPIEHIRNDEDETKQAKLLAEEIRNYYLNKQI